MVVANPVQELFERCPSAIGRHIHVYYHYSCPFDSYFATKNHFSNLSTIPGLE